MIPDPHYATVDAWLEANAISEWLPRYPEIQVGDGTITYTAYAYGQAPRAKTGSFLCANREPVIEIRTVPLRAPLTDEVRAAAWHTRVSVCEVQPDGSYKHAASSADQRSAASADTDPDAVASQHKVRAAHGGPTGSPSSDPPLRYRAGL